MPAERGIPIYGGGSVYIPVSHARNPDEILLSAEYWARQWKSATVLDENEQFGNATYAKGTRVGSAFRLDSFDLALAYRAQDDDGYLRGGASLLLHATGGKLKLSRAGTTEQETFGDLLWGGGLFGELRPQRFFLIGLSVKGYTNFGQDPGTGMADLRAFAGVDWKFLRFEGGLRYMPYAEAGTTDKKMSFDLYGPYVSLSLVWRF
ncbi:MAG: hypothetical protein JO332_18870 [Planctomycetaceae bacterium]|nr:hypothetical protein [Planctomycetaceae bacterium]